MRGNRGRRSGSTARLATAGLLALSLALSALGPTHAAPTGEDLEAAEARLDALNNHLSLLVEEFNQARVSLARAEARLHDLRRHAASLKAQADTALGDLSSRMAIAYTGRGSQLDVLLGSASMSEFSDRLTFLQALADADLDAVTRAQVKRRLAQRAAEDVAKAVRQREALVKRLARTRAEIEARIIEQQSLIRRLETRIARAEARARAARLAAERRAAEMRAFEEARIRAPAPALVPADPPPVSAGAAAAIEAAYSALGVPYQWGGSSPASGFDCSGLTMWAWAHAGVSLPHSSAAQYYATPRVSRGDLRPGDLLFFYTPIHHVAIYIGGGRMIHGLHPGTVVTISSLSGHWASEYVGAGRPGG